MRDLWNNPIIGLVDTKYFVRKRRAAKKEVIDDLSQKIVLNIILSWCYMGGFWLLIAIVWYDEILIAIDFDYFCKLNKMGRMKMKVVVSIGLWFVVVDLSSADLWLRVLGLVCFHVKAIDLLYGLC